MNDVLTYTAKTSSASTVDTFNICGVLLSIGKREMKIFGLVQCVQ